jgi:hypothetical protein
MIAAKNTASVEPVLSALKAREGLHVRVLLNCTPPADFTCARLLYMLWSSLTPQASSSQLKANQTKSRQKNFCRASKL